MICIILNVILNGPGQNLNTDVLGQKPVCDILDCTINLSVMLIIFFFQYIFLSVSLKSEAEKEIRSLNWDSDSSEKKMTGRSAVSYCSKKGKRLPEMNELAKEIHLFSNTSGHWTSYVYDGGSRVFCVHLKSGPVCSDQKENKKAYVRCVK